MYKSAFRFYNRQANLPDALRKDREKPIPSKKNIKKKLNNKKPKHKSKLLLVTHNYSPLKPLVEKIRTESVANPINKPKPLIIPIPPLPKDTQISERKKNVRSKKAKKTKRNKLKTFPSKVPMINCPKCNKLVAAHYLIIHKTTSSCRK